MEVVPVKPVVIVLGQPVLQLRVQPQRLLQLELRLLQLQLQLFLYQLPVSLSQPLELFSAELYLLS